MNILIFEYNNFGTEDVKECLEKKGYKYTVVETDEYRNRVSPEFDRLFEEKFSERNMIAYSHLIIALLYLIIARQEMFHI